MDKLAVLVPSRGRPASMAELRDAIRGTTFAAELVAILDEDDPTVGEYPRDVLSFVTDGGGLGMVPPLNEIAPIMAGVAPAVAFLGDDHRPRTAGWAERFLRELGDLGTGFVYGNDLLQGEAMPTAVAMTSNIVAALGYMAPPTLSHLNVDIAWLEWGKAIDRIEYLGDVVIEHLHPAIGKAVLDAGYERVNSQEMVARDGEAWDRYLHGDLKADVAKLQAIA